MAEEKGLATVPTSLVVVGTAIASILSLSSGATVRYLGWNWGNIGAAAARGKRSDALVFDRAPAGGPGGLRPQPSWSASDCRPVVH